MKNIIKKVFNTLTGLTPANLKVNELIHITANKPFERMQETRKRNLQRFVQIYYDSDISKFAKVQEKSIYFLIGMFKPFTSRICRPITTRTARLIECHMRLETGILDKENDPKFEQNYVPFIDIDSSFNNNTLSFSQIRPNLYVSPEKYNAKLLVVLDTSGLEYVAFENGRLNPIGEKYLINRNSPLFVHIYKRYGSKTKELKFNGEIIECI